MVHTNERSERSQTLTINRWPVKVASQPDESLSSWLIRCGLANYLEPMPLSLYLWDTWRAWTRDIDRRLPARQLKALSNNLSIHPAALSTLTLSPTIKLISRHQPNSQQRWFWVTSLSHRNRFRKNSSAFCPLCLTSDSVPYLRKSWRYSWITCCVYHKTQLQTACPHCCWPLHPYLQTLDIPRFSQCTSCHKSLLIPQSIQSADPRLLAMQQEGEELLRQNQADSSVWFQRLEFFISLVRRSCHAKTEGMKAVYNLIDIETPRTNKSPFGHFTFPELSHNDRYQLLKAASYFHTMQTNDLTENLLTAGLTQAQMVPAGIYCPDSLLAVKRSLPSNITTAKLGRAASNHWPEPRPKEAVQRLLDDLYREKRRRER